MYQKSPERDLFGNPVKPSEDSIEAGLTRRDEATLEERAVRWAFLEELRQGAEVHYIGPIEGGFLFRESELAFVDGHFAATILLALAIIEQMLQEWLYGKEAPRGRC